MKGKRVFKGGAKAGAAPARCSEAVFGLKGVKACDLFSLSELLSLRSKAVLEVDEAVGTLMEIDDFTPETVSTLMAKIKYLQDCMVLEAKATSESFPEDIPIRTALGQLTTAETQYRQATKQKDDLPEQTSASDVEKVQQ